MIVRVGHSDYGVIEFVAWTNREQHNDCSCRS